MVSADAEIIFEDWVSPDETTPEGPFGDHTGYYNATEPFPVMQAAAIIHRYDGQVERKPVSFKLNFGIE